MQQLIFSVIIQGTGINIDKGAEELIEAINISSGVALLIVGSGDVLAKLKKQVHRAGISRTRLNLFRQSPGKHL